MFGLLMFAGLALVCCAALIATIVGWRLGRRHGGSQRKAAGYATLGFLAIYLPLFYYQIPIWVTLRYSCWKDGGFIANVDPKEWNARNIQRLNLLSQEELEKSLPENSKGQRESWIKYGGLVKYSVRRTKIVGLGPGLGQVAEEWRDTSSNAVIAKRNRYGLGSVDDLRTWVIPGSCGNDIVADGESSRFFEKLVQRGER